MKSTPFRHKQTGEILRQIPVMQMANFEPFTGTSCYYSAENNTVIDIIEPESGLTACNLESRDEVRRRFPDAIEISLDDAAELHQRPFIEPVSEITAERFWYWLEVLFPEDWRNTADGESFKLCERTCGSITRICASLDGRYFTLSDKYTTPHKEIMRRVREYIAANPLDLSELGDYEDRVRALESEGMTRSDAQAVADAEGMQA